MESRTAFVSLVSTVPSYPVSPVPIISFEMAQRTRVYMSGHYFAELWRQTTRPGVFFRGRCHTSRSCGVKDMSVIRSAVGMQVAIVVLRRFLCVAGACRCARCDAATGASLTLRQIFRRRPAATAYPGQCIVQEKFLHT